MENNKKLIVEDEPNLGKVLLEYLSMKGFDTDIAENGEIGLKKFLNQQYDFVVLDIMMPKKDGFSLAQDIRKIDDKIPIIFLTAKSQKENVLKAFKIGADDYLTKPFSIDELLVRIKAIQKRLPKKEVIELEDEFKFASFTFFHKQNLLIVETT